MGKQPRYARGSMPDVPAEMRERDADVLSDGHYGPSFGRGQHVRTFQDLHPDLQEMLVRLDRQESENLTQGLRILVQLEPRDFARMRSILKFINVIYGIGWVLKWSIATFLTGLGAVTVAGDQILKIWGWVLTLLKIGRPS